MAPTSAVAPSRQPASLPDDVNYDSPATTPTAATPVHIFARQTAIPTDTGSDNDDNGSPGMINYYFVFFALILCIAGLCAYFVWRRRRNALMIYNNSRQPSYPPVREWDAMRQRRRYWNTGFRTAPVSREEGLNENGEAPPPYMPKDDQETGNNGTQANGQAMQGQNEAGGPAIPMQTLSREQAGLKPPEYDHVVQPSGSDSNGPPPPR